MQIPVGKWNKKKKQHGILSNNRLCAYRTQTQQQERQQHCQMLFYVENPQHTGLSLYKSTLQQLTQSTEAFHAITSCNGANK